jgi:hypothetical protein
MMHEDDRLDEALLRAVRELDVPPATPRDVMWARIQARRAERTSGAHDRADGLVHTAGRDAGENVHRHDGVIALRPRRRAWAQWSAALAAMLVIGIGLGRVSMQQAGSPAPAGGLAGAASSAPGNADAIEAADGVPTAYRLAASQHLQRTEALFASLAVDARTRGADELSGWARELLTDTRLLLSSPVATDPAMGRLLEDLELVLSQIAAIPAARAQEEVELIQDGINQSDVLLRMRAATAGPALAGT